MQEKEKIVTNTHFICINSENEYETKWFKKITDTNPKFDKNGKLTFVIIGNQNRMEINTLNMTYLVDCAKLLTRPKGRAAITTDKAYIYIKEVNEEEKMIGVLIHNHIKTFVPVNSKRTLE